MTSLQTRKDLYWVLCPDWLAGIQPRILRRMVRIATLPDFLLRYPWLLKHDVLILYYLEMPLTTRCTMRCAKCANLMQYYARPWDLPPADAKRYIKKLLSTVDHVFDFGLIGGETFLYAGLAGMVAQLCRSGKVGRVSLTTNATVVPKDEALLRALSNHKVYVKISDYGPLSRHLEQLKALFNSWNIDYIVLDMDSTWYDFGGMHERGRSEAELRSQFQQCNAGCHSYVRGQLHVCPRSSHGADLGLVPDNPGDYADLGDPKLNRKQRRKAISDMLTLDYVAACNYCDKGTPLHVQIPAAEQVPGRSDEPQER